MHSPREQPEPGAAATARGDEGAGPAGGARAQASAAQELPWERTGTPASRAGAADGTPARPEAGADILQTQTGLADEGPALARSRLGDLGTGAEVARHPRTPGLQTA